VGDWLDLRKRLNNIKILYGASEPKQVTFAITNQCNMTCSTCSFPDFLDDEKTHVPLTETKKAIHFLADNGVKMISLTGGEPLMHPDFLEICKYITKMDLMVSYISTNGILLTDQIASELSDLNINIIGLSIDVINDKGYGITRKVNILKTITKAKKILDKYNIDTYAGIVLGQHTIDIKNVIKTSRDLGFDKIIFSYPQIKMSSSYCAARDIRELSGDSEFWTELVGRILKEKRWSYHTDIFNTRINLNEFLKFYNGDNYTFDCPCGKVQFYLDWNLDMYRCLNSNEKYGNIRDLKDLNFDYSLCNACTQQAHRDYASFYHAFKTVKALEFSIRNLNIRKFFKILSNKPNRQALSSLFEGYLGGFV
jgi:MoaA/NifB/PqqE/SkfB family radical SAM enzyme